jgi:DNA-binding PadR family transcriptional regulator
LNTRLMVLGLLNDAPRHGYSIQRHLEESRVDAWADVRPGSIYQALKQLETEGLVEMRETAQTGHRVKAVYAITETGRAEFRRLLLHALAQPPRAFPSKFYTALTFLYVLAPEDALAAIQALIPRVEATIESWALGETIKNDTFSLTEPVRAVFANGREHLEADLRLLHRLSAHLRSAPPGTTDCG